MTYRLHIPADQHDIYKSLPDDARRDIASCLVDAVHDPLGVSEPYGEDDGIVRTLARGRAAVVILIGEQTSTITVLAIAYAG
ncbi:hypothetical protein ACF1AB_39175 [Streptomyces sp. NPDC014846]|uniref:hypothetical protein n=1 Tax=Streptomyces sp. NPDC014846 TaxID=3364922 RepID=UPI0036FFE733